MFDFINYGETIVIFVVFLVALYLDRGSKKKGYFLSILTGLMFLYTLIGMPITQKTKAEESKASYEKGATLSCTSGYLIFGSTFTVDKSNWDLEGNYYMDNQSSEKIRADKCEEI